MKARQDTNVAHPAVFQKRQQHVDDVGLLVGTIERTTKSFVLRGIENRRQRKTKLASGGRIESVVRADHRHRFSNRRAHLANRAAGEKFRGDFALRRPSLLQRDAQMLGCMRQDENGYAVLSERPSQQARKRHSPFAHAVVRE